jgi:hypothetical protein
MTESRALLRHAVATVAYRASKALREAPHGFGTFEPAGSSRTPAHVLAHMGDLFEGALTLALASSPPVWRESTPMAWDAEVTRFFDAVGRFDGYLASDGPLAHTAERLLQGPVADALTHIGQLAMLRRQFGSPLSRESYFKADVTVGRVGFDQAAPGVEGKRPSPTKS